MNPLIKVHHREIGGVAQPTVDARDLWSLFQPRSPFASWMFNKLRQHGFVEGKDFERTRVRRVIRYGRVERVSHQVDFVVSVSMAERIGAVEFCRGPNPWN